MTQFSQILVRCRLQTGRLHFEHFSLVFLSAFLGQRRRWRGRVDIRSTGSPTDTTAAALSDTASCTRARANFSKKRLACDSSQPHIQDEHVRRGRRHCMLPDPRGFQRQPLAIVVIFWWSNTFAQVCPHCPPLPLCDCNQGWAVASCHPFLLWFRNHDMERWHQDHIFSSLLAHTRQFCRITLKYEGTR